MWVKRQTIFTLGGSFKTLANWLAPTSVKLEELGWCWSDKSVMLLASAFTVYMLVAWKARSEHRTAGQAAASWSYSCCCSFWPHTCQLVSTGITGTAAQICIHGCRAVCIHFVRAAVEGFRSTAACKLAECRIGVELDYWNLQSKPTTSAPTPAPLSIHFWNPIRFSNPSRLLLIDWSDHHNESKLLIVNILSVLFYHLIPLPT